MPEIYEQLKNYHPPDTGKGHEKYGLLSPGRDTDDLVATIVMGWHIRPDDGHWIREDGSLSGWRVPGSSWCFECRIWQPSTDAVCLSTCEVIRRMAEDPTQAVMVHRMDDGSGGWGCRFWDQYDEAKTAQMAVCVTALGAVNRAVMFAEDSSKRRKQGDTADQ